MQLTFFYKNMLPAEEKKLRDYFSTKLKKLEKLLSHIPEDGAILQVKGEKFAKHSAYEVELNLKLPKGTLTAVEASHEITKAVDFAKDRLDLQLRKSLLLNRRQHRGIRAQSKAGRRAVSLV